MDGSSGVGFLIGRFLKFYYYFFFVGAGGAPDGFPSPVVGFWCPFCNSLGGFTSPFICPRTCPSVSVFFTLIFLSVFCVYCRFNSKITNILA